MWVNRPTTSCRERRRRSRRWRGRDRLASSNSSFSLTRGAVPCLNSSHAGRAALSAPPVAAGERQRSLKCRAYTYECLDCSRQTSITAGTAMHRSKLPLTTWFWAAHLMATHSNGMSGRQLEDQLGVTYKTAWLLAQKLRWSMIDRMRGASRRRRRDRSSGNSLSGRGRLFRAWRRRQDPRRQISSSAQLR